MSANDVFRTLTFDKKEVGLLVLFLADGSSSINNSDFKKQQGIILQLASTIKNNAPSEKFLMYFGITQFSDIVREECPPVQEFNNFIQKVKEMRQIKKNTNTHEALVQALLLLNLPLYKHCRKIVFLITDGVSETPADNVGRAIQKLATLIGFGIGVFDSHQLEMTCTRTFLSSSHEELEQEICKLASIPPPKITDNTLKISTVPNTKCELRSDKDLILDITIGNLSNNDLPKCVLVYQGGPYFYFAQAEIMELKQDTSLQSPVELILPIKPGVKKEDFPEELSVEMRVGDRTGELLGVLGLKLKTDMLRHEFECEVSPYNILLFGQRGSGKSALISTIFSTMRDSPKSAIAAIPGNNPTGHVTQEYSYWDLGKMLVDQGFNCKFPFYFFDTWGVTRSSELSKKPPYEVLEIAYFLDGRVPLLTKISELSTLAGKKDTLIPNPCLEIDAVLVTFPQAAIVYANEDNKGGDEWNHFRDCLQTIVSDRHLVPIVAVTMMDELENELNKKNINLVELKQQVASFLGLNGTQDIYLQTNYEGETDRNQKIDFDTRRIVLALQRRAQQRRANKAMRGLQIEMNTINKPQIQMFTHKQDTLGAPINLPEGVLLKELLPQMMKHFLKNSEYVYALALGKNTNPKFLTYNAFYQPATKVLNSNSHSSTIFVQIFADKKSEPLPFAKYKDLDHIVKVDGDTVTIIERQLNFDHDDLF